MVTFLIMSTLSQCCIRFMHGFDEDVKSTIPLVLFTFTVIDCVLIFHLITSQLSSDVSFIQKKYLPLIEARNILPSCFRSTRHECNPFISLAKRFFAFLVRGCTQINSVLRAVVIKSCPYSAVTVYRAPVSMSISSV